MSSHLSNDPHIYGSLKKYTLGFILCLILTSASFLIGMKRLLTGGAFIGAITFLALLQMIVQLVLFLHLGDETKPRYNLISFLFMVLVFVIIIFGSLWIMYSLNSYVMPDHGH